MESGVWVWRQESGKRYHEDSMYNVSAELHMVQIENIQTMLSIELPKGNDTYDVYTLANVSLL